jgi:hypothetical protein
MSAATVAFAALCAVACGSSAATGNPPIPAGYPSQRQSTNEPTVWNADSQAHSGVVSLQCRGGAGYEFKSLGYKASPNGDTRVAIALTFAASTTAAGLANEGLAPGTCALSDRPLTPAEPREVHVIVVAFSQPFVGPIDVSSTAAENHPDVRSMADYLGDPRRYWTFTAADVHQGYFDSWVHRSWHDFSGKPAPQARDEEPAAGEGRWFVRVMITGGVATSKREVSINADGHLQAIAGGAMYANVRCSADLSKPATQTLERALARSHPETWSPSYVLKGNPGGCCDQQQEMVHVEQEDANGHRTSRETFWFNDSAGTVPEGIASLAKLVFDARNACSAF